MYLKTYLLKRILNYIADWGYGGGSLLESPVIIWCFEMICLVVSTYNNTTEERRKKDLLNTSYKCNLHNTGYNVTPVHR